MGVADKNPQKKNLQHPK